MRQKKHGQKALQSKGVKHLAAEGNSGKQNLLEKDESLLNEIKRIKKLQKGLYKEYEAEEIEEDD